MRSPDLLKACARITRSTPRVRGVGRACQAVARRFGRWDGPPVVMRVRGMLMELDPREAIDRALIFTPQWVDWRELGAVRRILRPGDTVVDVGANVGSYTLPFATLVGRSGEVTAVEALPETAAILRRNIALNELGNVTVVEKGVSDTNEDRMLWVNRSGNRGASSFIERVGSTDEYQEQVVRCVPLTDIVTRPTRLLKVDIEGLEVQVIRAFLSQSSTRPDYILTEQWSPADDSEGVVELLTSAGYVVEESFGTNFLLRAQWVCEYK